MPISRPASCAKSAACAYVSAPPMPALNENYVRAPDRYQFRYVGKAPAIDARAKARF